MIDVPYAVKRALKDGNRPKQYRFQVLNDDETVDFVIDNDTLVKESVKIDERMCSGDRLKFGLCEGSSLEFQYFNHPNIRGRRVKVYLDVAYDNEGTEAYYPLSMGYYDVNQCSTQFSTGIIKAVGYNKLRSDYLDEKANDQIVEIVQTGVAGSSGNMEIGLILSGLLDGYTINPDLETVGFTFYSNAIFPPPRYQNYVRTEDGGYTDELIGYCYSETNICIENYDPTKVYRVWFNSGRIYELIAQCVPQEYWDEYVSNVDYPAWGVYSFNQAFAGSADLYVRLMISGEQNIRIVKDNYSAYTKWGTNFSSADYQIKVAMPLLWKRIDWDHTLPYVLIPTISITAEEDAYYKALAADIIRNPDLFRIEVDTSNGMEAVSFSVADAEALPDVTLRELQSAVYETVAQYGQLDRDTDLFYGVELNSGSLTPSATLYPSESLYPNQGYGNNIFRPFPSEYQKLWTDSVGEQTFRYLIITYKAIEYDQQGNPTEVDKTLQRTVHEHGTTNYNCSDNWLFRNLVWTAEQVGAYADAMVEKMLNIRWFPFEMWSTGLPYVEVGDAIEIADKEGDTHISYVLQRQLNGIQNLQDTYINGQLDIF